MTFSRAIKNHRPLLIRTHLWAQVLVAMALGIGLGLFLSPSGVALIPEKVAYDIAQWVTLPGQLFLASIQMVVIPLVLSLIILGIDRILDMCRTTVNVSGDLTACVVMDRWIGEEIGESKTAQPLPDVT